MATARSLDRAAVGCWVLKANPNIWDYDRSLADGPVLPNQARTSAWTVGGNYRKGLMEEDDLMVLLVTGRQAPGVYEIGRLTGPVEPVRGMDLDYAVDEQAARNARWAAPYEGVLLKEAVSRDELRADPVLRESEPLRAPQMSNPTFLTPGELNALAELLGGHITEDAADAVGWSRVFQ